ncbi:MAG: hypothetical protein ACAH83_07640 [Alphaproteobacteria bacterium]
MGINLNLETERGEVLQSLLDPEGTMARLLSPYCNINVYPMLGSIDPYGDTVFNRIQMGLFLGEWSKVLAKNLSPEERVVADQIEKLAQRCRDEVHLYLKFIGD